MDKRRMKFKSSLHEGLKGSQTTLRSVCLSFSELKSSDEESFSRKRKSSNFTATDDEDDDLEALSAESTVIKKKRCEPSNTQQVRNNENRNSASMYSSTATGEHSRRIASNNLNVSNSSNTPQKVTSSNSNALNVSRIIASTDSNAVTGRSCRFVDFLRKSGITLNTDGPHMLNKDLVIVRQRMKKLLKSGSYNKAEIIESMEKYIENERNFQNALNDMEISVNSEISNVLHCSSLIKTLLQVSELHPEIYSNLLCKLNESVLIADSIEEIPWVRLLLQQFRFLDVVINDNVLTVNLEQLLESCPIWFQTELILFIPDIVSDKQHHAIADILNKLLEDNSDLINPILNCMSSLSLGKEYLNEHKNNVLNLLKTNTKIAAVPAMVNFILEDCTDIDILKKMLMVLRNIDMQPLVGEKPEDCYKNQLDIIRTLKMNILLSENIVNATIAVIKDINKNPKPFDIILLLIIFSSREAKRKNIDTMFKKYIRSGFYRLSLLCLFYNDYKQVAEELQSAASQLSSNLLKSDERVFIDFGIEWFRLQFMSHKDGIFKQREILEKIILLIGFTDQTAKNALAFLCKMVEKEEERQCLALHCNHLRILLEKMDNFSLEEVRTLTDILHNLCTNSSSVSASLRDDLFILLRKQLNIFNPLTKCKGVLGAVMAIKHLMGKAETSETAYDLFRTALTSVKNCPKSKALFYDELSRIITQTETIDTNFMQKITDYIEEEFINTYMVNRNTYDGELVPKYGLNNVDDEPEDCVLNFENNKFGAIVPISFKLLRTCCIKLSENGDLDTIDSLLGCSILMPTDLDVGEHATVDLVICCINWFREVINGFVLQKDALLQKLLLKRLDNLIYLQGELTTLLSLCDSKYQPPHCYFHHFPTPLFVRSEKKVGKKGKKGKKGKNDSAEKSANLSETDSWESGSVLCSKNPAYFRKLDAMIVHLLDIKMELHTSQPQAYNISLQQVCFIVKELLVFFENDLNETFVRDLVTLLPKICSKFQDIVDMLRDDNNSQGREVARLLLCLLTKIFNWKGFESVTYNMLLRDGLRTLAGQINEANGMLRSCKQLVTESYKYFESLSDIATQISLAIALINMCQALMKHSESYTKEYKDKHAKMAYAFLCLEWPEDKHYTPQYKAAVNGLINNWIDNEPLPLKTVTTVLEWLPDDSSNLKNHLDCVNRIPSVRKNNFHFLYKKVFDGLIKGVKISVPLLNTDPEKIELWQEVASNVQKLVHISKVLKTKNNILIFLRYMPLVLRQFINLGMPILEHNLKYQPDDVTKILKMMQGGTRYLHTICCDSAENKDIALTKYVPVAKSVLERLIYSVKGMLVLNNSPAAFWMGNLINKNLDGREILSQNQSSEESSLPTTDTVSDNGTDESAKILDSDLDDDSVDESADGSADECDDV